MLMAQIASIGFKGSTGGYRKIVVTVAKSRRVVPISEGIQLILTVPS
jgi:hypothetical protein